MFYRQPRSGRLMFRLAIVLFLLAWFVNEVRAEKPKLEGFIIASQVECPTQIEKICFLLNKGETWYVVQGEGYGKEETIWLVNREKAMKATNTTPYSEFMKLVWARGKDAI